jgi:hypothetical protein
VVEEPVIRAVYQALGGHVPRTAGIDIWGRGGPRYGLNAEEEAEYLGRLDKVERSKFQEWIRWQTQKSSIGRRLMEWRRPVLPEDDTLFLAIVARSRKLIKEKYPAAEFHVIFWDDDAGTYQHLVDGLRERGIAVHLLSKIIPYRDDYEARYTLPLDGHPAPAAHRRIAGYVVTNLIGEIEKATAPL